MDKDGDHGASSSGVAHLEQDEPADMDVQHEDPTEDFQEARPSAADRHQGERMPTMSSFERQMMDRLDSFAEIETIDCFWLFFSGFKISFLLLLLFYSDVMKTISCFISYLCLFVKTNRGRYMLCFEFVLSFCFKVDKTVWNM